MKPIGKNIICKKIKKEVKQGLLILPTKTDYDEYEIISVGLRCNDSIKTGCIIRVASHIKGIPIENDNEFLYILKEDDISLLLS